MSVGLDCACSFNNAGSLALSIVRLSSYGTDAMSHTSGALVDEFGVGDEFGVVNERAVYFYSIPFGAHSHHDSLQPKAPSPPEGAGGHIGAVAGNT